MGPESGTTSAIARLIGIGPFWAGHPQASTRFRPAMPRYRMSVVEQQLGTAALEDGTVIRFAVAGNGAVSIHVRGWVSHLELGWALPAERHFYEGLATGRTLVRYDRPGSGLSGATGRTDIVEVELEVLQVVAHAVKADRFDLIGASFGAPLAVKW